MVMLVYIFYLYNAVQQAEPAFPGVILNFLSFLLLLGFPKIHADTGEVGSCRIPRFSSHFGSDSIVFLTPLSTVVKCKLKNER